VGFLFGEDMKLGKIPIDVSGRLRPVISDSAETVYEVLCLTRFTGFDKRHIGDNRTTVSTGKETVIGKIVLAEGTIGHEQIIATALETMRDRFNSAKRDCVVHIPDNTPSYRARESSI
jgi:hypothetical protein